MATNEVIYEDRIIEVDAAEEDRRPLVEAMLREAEVRGLRLIYVEPGKPRREWYFSGDE
jgi:hypothetical protein